MAMRGGLQEIHRGSRVGMRGCLQEQFAIVQDEEEAQRKPPAVKALGRDWIRIWNLESHTLGLGTDGSMQTNAARAIEQSRPP